MIGKANGYSHYTKCNFEKMHSLTITNRFGFHRVLSIQVIGLDFHRKIWVNYLFGNGVQKLIS